VNLTVLVARQLKHFFIRKWISRSNYPESIDASKQNVVARDLCALVTFDVIAVGSVMNVALGGMPCSSTAYLKM
jgi:hypothetical protein